MVDAFKAFIVIILLVVSFVVYPAYRTADQTDQTAERVAEAALFTFVDTVRGKGYIEVRDYDIFLKSLDATGQTYDVTLEYYKKKLQPNYNGATFQDTFHVRYDGYFTSEILGVLYKNDTTTPVDHPDRKVNMYVGDLFNVRIESTGRTLSSGFKSFLFQTPNIPIVLRYGGMVRSEAP
ncbi:hypothetical protein [Longirhabdus pacifica]|uniref:hypothetical protein n=1 Tax=Longirhabdus pacifica TaxID=2305227 RepID=UPI001008E1E9|nr:hypothetical protein [Longirhabdus pacifica]